MSTAEVMTSPAGASVEREGMHTLVTSVASVAAGFATSVLVARALGPAGKGVLDLVTASTGLFSLVLGGSLAAGLTSVVARQRGLPAAVIRPLALWCGIATLITGAVLALANDFSQRLGLTPEGTDQFWPIYIAAAVFAALGCGFLRGALIGLRSMIPINRIDLGVRVASLTGFALLLVVAAHNVRAFALISLAASFGLGLAYLTALRGKTGKAPGADADTFRELLRASLPLHGANVLNFVTHRVDVFFVQAQHGAREVGVYALAVSLAQFLLLASGAFAQPLLPSLAAQTDPAEAGRIAARITRLYLVIAILGATGVAAVMTWALPLIFGRAFGPSVAPLLVLLPGVIAFGATNILISYFFGQGHTTFNLALAVAGLVVTLAGNLTLTPRYGALGAAITSTLAYGAAGVLAVMGLVRFSRVGAFEALWPRGADFRELGELLWRFRI